MMMGEEEEEEDGPSDVELPPVLVTFEGSARGLNFDAVITSSWPAHVGGVVSSPGGPRGTGHALSSRQHRG